MHRGIVLLAAVGGLALAAGAVRAPARPDAEAPCRPAVSLGVLPAWARGGFSDPKPRIPHVLGRDGRIVAIVFGYPLLSPPSKTRGNKILWVARAPAQGRSTLRISAQKMEGSRDVGQPVRRTVDDGPGPSIVDLPAAGCWRLTLRWSGRVDAMDVVYRSTS